jgi:hypothetical protein
MCTHMPTTDEPLFGGPTVVIEFEVAIVGRSGTATAASDIVNAQHISLATVTGSGSTTSMAVSPRDPDSSLTALVRDVRDVIRHLEAPGPHEPLRGVVAKCNASLENCLESERERREGDASAGSARDELKRLVALLAKVEPADAAMVMRQIRRVLGRFDART